MRGITRGMASGALFTAFMSALIGAYSRNWIVLALAGIYALIGIGIGSMR